MPVYEIEYARPDGSIGRSAAVPASGPEELDRLIKDALGEDSKLHRAWIGGKQVFPPRKPPTFDFHIPGPQQDTSANPKNVAAIHHLKMRGIIR